MDDLVTMSCVLENEHKGQDWGHEGHEKQRGQGHQSPSSSLSECKARSQSLDVHFRHIALVPDLEPKARKSEAPADLISASHFNPLFPPAAPNT